MDSPFRATPSVGSRRTLSAGIIRGALLEFECVWCHRSIEVDHAGWPYIQSIALLHFHTCPQRPVNATADTIQAAAARVADVLEREIRGK